MLNQNITFTFYSLLKIFCVFNFHRVSPATKIFEHQFFSKLQYGMFRGWNCCGHIWDENTMYKNFYIYNNVFHTCYFILFMMHHFVILKLSSPKRSRRALCSHGTYTTMSLWLKIRGGQPENSVLYKSTWSCSLLQHC